MHVNRTYIILLFFTFIFSNKTEFENISFKSADPFSFRDIIVDLKNLEEQEVSGILTFPKNNNLNIKYPLIIAVRLKNIKEIDGLLINHQNIITPIGKIIITNGDVLIPIRKNNI